MTLVLEHVSVGFRDGDDHLDVLRDLSARFHPGQLTAVTGPSGSGKSTLLAVAAGLLRPDRGRILIDGIEFTALGDRDRTRLRRERIGVVLQSGNLLPALTALDQLLVVPDLQRRRDRASSTRALRLLERVGVGHRASHRPGELSGGERQRVALARALMADPSVLLVDEPTAAIDRRQATSIASLLADVTHADGCTTIVVTHDPSVLTWADHALPLGEL